MLLSYLALAIGLIGLVLAWSANRKNKELQERLAQLNSRLYQLRRENQEAQEQAAYDTMQLKFQLLRLEGNLKVTPDMKIGEVIALHPQAQQLLAGFHLGGCSGCAVEVDQSLAEAVALNGRDLEPILAALNTLIAASSPDHSNGPVSPEKLKTPNVQVHF